MQQKKSAYRIGAYESNAMRSTNPLSGIYQTDISATLDTSGGNPACDQGGIAIVEESIKSNGFCAYANGTSRGIGYIEEKSPTIKTGGTIGVLVENISKTVIDTNPTDARYTIAEGVCQTLRSRMGTGGNNEPLVLEEHTEQTLYDAYQHSGYRQSDVCGPLKTENCNHVQGGTPLIVSESEMQSDKDEPILMDAYQHNGYRESEVCSPLTACNMSKSLNGGTPLVLQKQNPISIENGQTCQLTDSNSDVARTPDCQDGQQLIGDDVVAVDCRKYTENTDVNCTLQAHGNGGLSVNTNNIVRIRSIVRRLTPLEAERLQGFEDEWTAGESDSARYKALGNSVALPCVNYIFSGIMDVLDPDGIVKNSENIN